jgi:hypothetical protein
MAWYAALGLPMLSDVLADRPTIKASIRCDTLTSYRITKGYSLLLS